MADYLVTYEELQSVANAIRVTAGLDPLSRTGGDYIVDEDDLIDLADAIRSMTETEADLEWPDDFISEIESLSGMTIPAGTTTLAFPQDYIDIIETATTEEEPCNVTVNLYYISQEMSQNMGEEDTETAYGNAGDIETLYENFIDESPGLYSYTYSDVISNDTLDLSNLFASLYNEFGEVEIDTNYYVYEDSNGIVDNLSITNEELTIDEISEDSEINILIWDEVKTYNITIYAVYIPSPSQLQAANQRGIISMDTVRMLSDVYSDEARNKIPIVTGGPVYSQSIIPYLKSQISSDTENSIFEGTIQCSSESFANSLGGLIINIADMAIITKGYDPALLPDNVAFVNVNPSTYEEVETGAQVCYQGEPVQTIFGYLRSGFDANDLTIENLGDNLYLEIRLMADDQVNDLL